MLPLLAEIVTRLERVEERIGRVERAIEHRGKVVGRLLGGKPRTMVVVTVT
jgi:hypothetical protein